MIFWPFTIACLRLSKNDNQSQIACFTFVIMRKILVLLIISLPMALAAQEKWDLKKCVEYAMKNNISVRQADVQARISVLQLKQATYNQYPSANFSTNAGMQFGRSIDPLTNQFTTTQLLFQGYSLTGGVDVYNWGRLKNARQAAQFSANAALADVERASNDIALNVCTFYLQALLAKEQTQIASIQIEQTKTRLDMTSKRVDAGALPELNRVEIESQLATDSANYINAKTLYTQALLSLKGLLNLDPALPFEIETPPVDAIPVENLLDLQPDMVYQLAANHFPQQKVDSFRIKAASKNIKAARSFMYPTLSFGFNLGTTFANTIKTIDPSSVQFNGYKPDGSNKVLINGVYYDVLAPDVTFSQYNRNFSQIWEGYGKQLDNNFRQSLAFTLSVPIFNNGTARINYERSKLDYQSVLLAKEQNDLKLKQDIYTAYTNATNALEKYNASKRNVEAAQKAYDFAVKRNEVGLLSTLDLLITQNNLNTARIQQKNNQYEYIFRIKLLEFYKGQGLKL